MRGVAAPGVGSAPSSADACAFGTVLRDSAIVLAICSAVALTVNAARRDGIALVQRVEYQILVPCPETTGETEAFEPEDPRLREPRTLLIDARSRVEFERWHVSGAAHVPFDYLAPTEPETIRKIAASGAGRVVVYGDGDDPDSGEQLARELAGKGIRNVGYVAGGAAALKGMTSRGSVR